MTAERPTARDVAKRAGVSVATVSYVLSGRDRPVADETRQRVLDAAGELGYTPNLSARSLRSRRTQRVCLVQRSIGGVPADDRISSDLHEMADARGFGVVSLAVYSPERAVSAQELLLGQLADAALIAHGTDHLTYDMLAALDRAGLPMVVIRNGRVPDHCDVVRSPEAEACAEAVEHLVARGRRRIAFMAHRYELYAEDSSPRVRGYTDTLDRHGIGDQIIVAGAESRIAGYRSAQELLNRPDPPDAIFAASDRAAISTIWAARDAGIRVPDDLAVIGTGNIDEGEITQPPLSTAGPLTHDYTEVVGLLFDRLQGGRSMPGRELIRPWSFIQRESS